MIFNKKKKKNDKQIKEKTIKYTKEYNIWFKNGEKLNLIGYTDYPLDNVKIGVVDSFHFTYFYIITTDRKIHTIYYDNIIYMSEIEVK